MGLALIRAHVEVARREAGRSITRLVRRQRARVSARRRLQPLAIDEDDRLVPSDHRGLLAHGDEEQVPSAGLELDAHQMTGLLRRVARWAAHHQLGRPARRATDHADRDLRERGLQKDLEACVPPGGESREEEHVVGPARLLVAQPAPQCESAPRHELHGEFRRQRESPADAVEVEAHLRRHRAGVQRVIVLVGAFTPAEEEPQKLLRPRTCEHLRGRTRRLYLFLLGLRSHRDEPRLQQLKERLKLVRRRTVATKVTKEVEHLVEHGWRQCGLVGREPSQHDGDELQARSAHLLVVERAVDELPQPAERDLLHRLRKMRHVLNERVDGIALLDSPFRMNRRRFR